MRCLADVPDAVISCTDGGAGVAVKISLKVPEGTVAGDEENETGVACCAAVCNEGSDVSTGEAASGAGVEARIFRVHLGVSAC